MIECHFTIAGNPPIKKNSRSIGRTREGRLFPMKSSKLRAAEEWAILQLKQQKFRGFAEYQHPIHVRFLFYRKDKRHVDLSNLYEFAQDCLQEAGIIADDVLIESHDGSRKLYDPHNERTEIFISPYEP